MVPADDHFRSTGLLEHVEHFRLKDRIDSFDANTRTRLWHSEHVGDAHSVIIDEFTEHQPTGERKERSSTRGSVVYPITSIGTPARPCFNIFSSDNEEM